MVKIGGTSLPPRPQTSEEVRESDERHGLKGPEAKKGEGAQRVAQPNYVEQSDFVGSGAKRRNTGLDLGDDSHAPIPLPKEDVDTSQWSLEGLDVAQSRLLNNSGRLRRARAKKGDKLKGLLALWQELLEEQDDEGQAGSDDEERRKAALEGLAQEAPPSQEAMAQVVASVAQHFGVELANNPVGAQMMATSLLVAGQTQAVGLQPEGGIDAQRLSDGVQHVMDESQSAVDDARRMHEGVHKNLSFQRTFLAKKR